MYLYLLDFGHFIKVGISIDLKLRVYTHERNFNKTFKEETSLFWDSEEKYIKFIESHIKSYFPVFNDERYQCAEGHTEMFHKEDESEIKNMINNYFSVLCIRNRSGLIDEELFIQRYKPLKKRKKPTFFGAKKTEDIYLNKIISLITHKNLKPKFTKYEDSERFSLKFSLNDNETYFNSTILNDKEEVIGQLKEQEIIIYGDLLGEEITEMTGISKAKLYQELNKRKWVQ